MNEQEIFNNKLDEIRKNMIIELKRWWGHRYAGYSGIIITNNKEVYKYNYYHREPEEIKGKGNFIEKTKILNDDEFEKITTFINEELLNKEFKDKMIFDAGYSIVINYNGVKKSIINNKGYGDQLEIYDKTENLLKDII